MKKLLLQSIRQTLLWAVVTGIAYPLVITLIAQVAFKDQANGSLVTRDGKIIGSALLAQQFQGTNYFWPRPSGLHLRHRGLGPRSFEREQPGPYERRVANQCGEQYRGLYQWEQPAHQCRRAAGHGVRLRQRSGSAHQPRGRPAPNRTCRRRARPERGTGQDPGGPVHRSTPMGVPWAGAGERAVAQRSPG